MFTRDQVHEAAEVLRPFYRVNGNKWESRERIEAPWVPVSVWAVKEQVEDTLNGVASGTSWHAPHHYLQAYYRIRYLLSANDLDP